MLLSSALVLFALELFSPSSHAAKLPFFGVKLPWTADHTTEVSDGFTPPKWYHGNDGPIFGVEESREGDVERRSYHPTVWASTNFTEKSFDEAYQEGVKRLDSYWGGKNVPEKQIAQTVPTFIQMYPSKEGDRTVKQKWTVEYFVPHELHAKPYAPSAEDVNVLKFGQMDVWVKVFGGYAKEEDVINRAFDFFDELDDAGIKVRTDIVGVAFYDKPYHIVGRHNEIWAWPEEKQEMSTEDIHMAWAKLQQNMEEVLRQNVRG